MAFPCLGTTTHLAIWTIRAITARVADCAYWGRPETYWSIVRQKCGCK